MYHNRQHVQMWIITTKPYKGRSGLIMIDLKILGKIPLWKNGVQLLTLEVFSNKQNLKRHSKTYQGEQKQKGKWKIEVDTGHSATPPGQRLRLPTQIL